MEHKFSQYARRMITEEKVASRLVKSVIDVMTDYIYSINGISNDEKKQIVDNLKVSIEPGDGGTGTKLVGDSTFMKNGQISTTFNASVSITYNIGGGMPVAAGPTPELPAEPVAGTSEELPPEAEEELPPETTEDEKTEEPEEEKK